MKSCLIKQLFVSLSVNESNKMPCVKIINSIKIYIYSRDHNPPHFHALYAEFEELIIIENLQTYAGAIPAKQRKNVINWAKTYQDYLFEKWHEYNPDN